MGPKGTTMKNPNPNMLLRIAQGDAYAAAVEYVNKQQHQELYAKTLGFSASYQQHPTHLDLRPGMYTDDTQMSVAVSEVLLSSRLEPGDFPTKRDFLAAFFRCFKRDERDGYSRNFQAILEKSKSVEELEVNIDPTSDKNGAAMRAVPLGVVPDVQSLIVLAGLQASVTHDTWGGINSAIAVALMSHFALYEDRGFDSMLEWCVRQQPAFAKFQRPWTGPVKAQNDKDGLGVGMITAHAVHTLLTTQGSMMGIMRQVLEWGGDTDSVAAIAWGIASARYQDEPLPEFMERDLEPGGQYGPAFLKSLGAKLMTRS